MNNEKMVLCYGVDELMIAVRKQHFDWSEGDVINTDGVKTEVYAVFDYNQENMLEMYRMFAELNTPSSMNYIRKWLHNMNVLDEPEYTTLEDWPELIDTLNYMKCTKETIKKRTWGKDYDKCLDYMESCCSQIV